MILIGDKTFDVQFDGLPLLEKPNRKSLSESTSAWVVMHDDVGCSAGRNRCFCPLGPGTVASRFRADNFNLQRVGAIVPKYKRGVELPMLDLAKIKCRRRLPSQVRHTGQVQP